MLDTREELEYYKLLYNFEDTKRFYEQRQLGLAECKRDVNSWFREANKIIETKKSHSHFKYIVELVKRMDLFLKLRY